MGPCLHIFARCFFFSTLHGITVNRLSPTATQRRNFAEKLLFEFHSCSNCPFSDMSVFCLHIATCVCLFPAPVSCEMPSEHTHRHTHSHCCQTHCGSALDPHRSSVIWQRHIFSLFLVHFQAPTVFFSFRYSLCRFLLSSLLLRFLSSPIQVNHPIVYLMKGTAVFFSPSLLYLQQTDCTATVGFFCPK